MSFRLLATVIALSSLTACFASSKARDKVLQTASFEHRCPVDKVRVVQENDEIWAYVLDVCGQQRLYRDMGNEKEFQFVDVTDKTANAPAAR